MKRNTILFLIIIRKQTPDESVSPYRLSASVEPEMATNGNVTWNSDTPEVATVDEFGRVTPVSAGVATITATTEDGGYTASAKIYVPTVSESFDNRQYWRQLGSDKGKFGGNQYCS